MKARRKVGRPKGSGDKGLQIFRDAVEKRREALIAKAVKLALARRPNIPVLLKLLDKILPSLHSQEVSGTLRNGLSFEDMPRERVENFLKAWEGKVIEKYRKTTEAGFETREAAHLKRGEAIEPAARTLPASPSHGRLRPESQPPR